MLTFGADRVLSLSAEKQNAVKSSQPNLKTRQNQTFDPEGSLILVVAQFPFNAHVTRLPRQSFPPMAAYL